MTRLVEIVSLACLSFLISGCQSFGIEWDRHSGNEREHREERVEQGQRGGPPPWAPAHGYRRKQAYRYYHDHEIYYHAERAEYVWLEAGRWRVGYRLPSSIRLDLGRDPYVVVEVEGSRPQDYHHQIKRTHPKGGPKKGESRERGRGRGRGRGPRQ